MTHSHRNKLPLILAFFVIIIGSFVFLTVGGRALVYAPDDTGIKVFGGLPWGNDNSSGEEITGMHIEIPELGINARVEEVGINGKGNMATPAHFENVGWYKYGTKPGEKGSAVVTGHLDNGLGLEGVFKHLENLKVGDDVYVVEDGERLHFVVESIKTYPYKAVPTEAIFTRADGIRLNLVGCAGNWVKSDKTYDHRLIVYTRLVNT